MKVINQQVASQSAQGGAESCVPFGAPRAAVTSLSGGSRSTPLRRVQRHSEPQRRPLPVCVHAPKRRLYVFDAPPPFSPLGPGTEASSCMHATLVRQTFQAPPVARLPPPLTRALLHRARSVSHLHAHNNLHKNSSPRPAHSPAPAPLAPVCMVPGTCARTYAGKTSQPSVSRVLRTTGPVCIVFTHNASEDIADKVMGVRVAAQSARPDSCRRASSAITVLIDPPEHL